MLGKFNAGSIVICYIPFLVITPFISYFFAVHYKEQKPFPHATITQTACHYPQDIIVRYFMVMAGSILSLVFFIMFKWLAKAIKDSGFDQKISMGLYYLSQFSILMFSITLGTIDGKGTGPLHSPCAVIFFIILITQIVYITLLLTRIRQFQTNIISKGSLRLKQILAFINVAVWVYCLFKGKLRHFLIKNRQICSDSLMAHCHMGITMAVNMVYIMERLLSVLTRNPFFGWLLDIKIETFDILKKAIQPAFTNKSSSCQFTTPA